MVDFKAQFRSKADSLCTDTICELEQFNVENVAENISKMLAENWNFFGKEGDSINIVKVTPSKTRKKREITKSKVALYRLDRFIFDTGMFFPTEEYENGNEVLMIVGVLTINGRFENLLSFTPESQMLTAPDVTQAYIDGFNLKTTHHTDSDCLIEIEYREMRKKSMFYILEDRLSKRTTDYRSILNYYTKSCRPKIIDTINY